jgi:N6-L-threonylcarbamoyladenine synthase
MEVTGIGQYTTLGDTLDDAAGEAFDKTAKLLGLGYPGGPALSTLAQQGTPGRFSLPRPMLKSGDLNFSFSGLKTAVLTLAKQQTSEGRELDEQTKADICLAFQEAIVEVLTRKAVAALRQTGLSRLVVAGGVGANKQLRDSLSHAAAKKRFEVFYPKLEFCTDNGAMIAFAGAMRLRHQGRRTMNFPIKPRWDLETLEAP